MSEHSSQILGGRGRQPLDLTKEKDVFFLVGKVNTTGTHRIVFPFEGEGEGAELWADVGHAVKN